VSQKVCLHADTKQLMEQSRVAEVDLRRFHLSLGEILMPALKLSHHEDAR
jgi:hypothetical protein